MRFGIEMEIATWMNIDSKHIEQQGASCTCPWPRDQPIPDKESFSHIIQQQYCIFLIQVNF